MKRSVGQIALAALVAVVGASAYAEVVILNSPTGGSIGVFGYPDSQTYGQVFTAPVTGKIDSFTMWLNGGVGALHGAVGLWNGTPGFGYGFGESVNLYTSESVVSSSGGPYTFNPNVDVVAGSLYVAYLSVFGESSAITQTRAPNGTLDPYLNYLVWNNTSDPKNNGSWNYFDNFGQFQFEAHFSSVPEIDPAGMGSVLALVTGAVGLLERRRKRD